MNLSQYNCNGIQLFINDHTGECFATSYSIGNLIGKKAGDRDFSLFLISYQPVEARLTNVGFESSLPIHVYPEETIFKAIVRWQPAILSNCQKGLRSYLHSLVNYSQESTNISFDTSFDFQEEAQNLIDQNKDIRIQNNLLKKDICLLLSAIDNLFEYSSIQRIANYNHLPVGYFNQRSLELFSNKLKFNIISLPQDKYLYHHRVWLSVYPEASLPVSTTLTINNTIGKQGWDL